MRPNAEDRSHPGEATAASHAVGSGIFLFGSDLAVPPKALRDGIAALQDGAVEGPPDCALHGGGM
jgi:hypothetical protein